MEERGHLYGGRRPKDYLPAHNHIMHTDVTTHGERGFRRFWIPPEYLKRGEWAQCPCGWGKGLKWGKPGKHYAWTEHAKGWKAQIKKCGSLEAAYRAVDRRLEKAWRTTEK